MLVKAGVLSVCWVTDRPSALCQWSAQRVRLAAVYMLDPSTVPRRYARRIFFDLC